MANTQLPKTVKLDLSLLTDRLDYEVQEAVREQLSALGFNLEEHEDNCYYIIDSIMLKLPEE